MLWVNDNVIGFKFMWCIVDTCFPLLPFQMTLCHWSPSISRPPRGIEEKQQTYLEQSIKNTSQWTHTNVRFNDMARTAKIFILEKFWIISGDDWQIMRPIRANDTHFISREGWLSFSRVVIIVFPEEEKWGAVPCSFYSFLSKQKTKQNKTLKNGPWILKILEKEKFA